MRLPDATQRIAIIGRTGSGKTQAAAWHLSRVNFDKMPWIIFDWKKDKLLNSIRAKEIDVKSGVPSKPGLYITHPLPNDDEAVEKLLWRIWEHERIGVYVDEGYMMGDSNPAFRALLTQGRSKEIPMIVLSQRPVWMDRFVFSEADFYQVFSLNDAQDRQRVRQFIHKGVDMEADLPRFHSWYHDVAQNEYCLLQPVPPAGKIRASFKERIGVKRRAL